MSKIKDFFQSVVINYKNSFKQYTATNIVIIVTTLFLVFAYNSLAGTIINKTLTIAIISAINFFACETYLKKSWQRGASYVASIVIAVLFEKLIFSNTSIGITRICIGYLIIVFLVGLMQAIKNTKADVGEYSVKVLKNLLNVGIVYAILNIGLTLISLIFISLILSYKEFGLLGRLQIALFGLLVLPASLVAITEIKQDFSKFIKAIILYIMLPLTLLATAIIYIYMAKIFIIREVPANSIFRIITGLFIVAFPVWVMIDAFKKESKIVEKICKILPIAFIPFLLLQTYSICARIDGNGLTPSRYIGIAFIVFEAIAIFLSLYKERKYLIHTITTAIALIAISTILPVVNMESASNISQANRLKRAWRENQSFSELSEDNKKTAWSAYIYLSDQKNAKKYIPNYIDEEEINEYMTSKKDGYESDLYSKSVRYPEMYIIGEDEFIPVGEYKYTKKTYSSTYDKSINGMKDFELTNSIKVDFKEFVNNIIKARETSEKNANDYIEANKIIKIDDNTDFYITDLDLTYKNEQIRFFSVDGYILKK